MPNVVKGGCRGCKEKVCRGQTNSGGVSAKRAVLR